MGVLSENATKGKGGMAGPSPLLYTASSPHLGSRTQHRVGRH